MGKSPFVIYKYISTVAETARDPIHYTLSLNPPDFKYPMIMLSKICHVISSLLSGMQNTWKCLINLGVRGDLPPLGGAAAQTST